MMTLQLNGQDIEAPLSATLADVLQQNGFSGMAIAAAVNGAFVPKNQYRTLILKAGDRLDVVAPMQGG